MDDNPIGDKFGPRHSICLPSLFGQSNSLNVPEQNVTSVDFRRHSTVSHKIVIC